MSLLTRRGLVAAASALPLIPRRARAAEIKLIYADNANLKHPVNVRARQVAERVRAETDGPVVIEIFPNSELGGDTDTISQLRSGGIDMLTLSGLILSMLVPAAAINGVGFAFPDYAAVWKAMDGALGAYVRGQIAKSDLIAMDRMWDNGFRQMTTSDRPIRTQADLDGLKIRVPTSPLWVSLFKALGASPTGINFAENYSALQTHIVDGQEQPLIVIETSKLYEVQTYCSLTNHMWDGYWWLVNRRSWEAIPPDLRDIVARNINQSALDERRDIVTMNASMQSVLERQGLTFNATEPASFVAALQRNGFYAKWQRRFGDHAWSLLEQASGRLT